MNAMPTGLYTALHTLSRSRCGEARTSPQMVDGADGTARLVFKAAGQRQRTALLRRWLAIVRIEPRAERSTSVLWLLDGGTTCWSRGLPPGELQRGATGLDSEANPTLWFHARGGVLGRRGFKAARLFGAAGIVDGAMVRATRSRITGQVRLRLTAATQIWGLSDRSVEDMARMSTGPKLVITASGVPRSLELAAIEKWL